MMEDNEHTHKDRLPSKKHEKVEFDPNLLEEYYRIQSIIERQSEDQYGNLCGYDDIDILEEQMFSREKFNSISKEDRCKLCNAILMFSENSHATTGVNNNGIKYNLLLGALKLTGRETDREFVLELEGLAGRSLKSVRVAVELYDLTYKMWSLNNWIKPYFAKEDYTAGESNTYNSDSYTDFNEEQGQSIIVPEIAGVEYYEYLKYLKEIKENANSLALHEVEATHATSPGNLQSILKDGYIVKSATEFSHHFEGDGVYCGILGSYRNWCQNSYGEEEGDTLLEFKVPLSQTIPIIVSYLSPKAMCNVLTNKLILERSSSLDKNLKVSYGAPQWLDEEKDGELSKWKIDMLKDLFNCEVELVKDEFNKDMLILDTKEPAIVWGSVARTLRLRRVVPLSSINELALPESITNDIYNRFTISSISSNHITD